MLVNIEFQFHNGSIKSFMNSSILKELSQFQFHNGSIKRRSDRDCRPTPEPVSIPQWFD